MRLGFDASSLTSQGKGLARFQGEFLRALAGLALVDDLTVFVPVGIAGGALPEVAGWRYLPARTQPMIRWEQVGLPVAARRERLDVVVTTSERAALWGPPQVVYIYEHPRHRARRGRETSVPLRQRAADAVTRGLFELSMRRAAAILAASRATAGDLARFRGVRVVYSAASPEFAPDPARAQAIRTELGTPSGYFLHLASDDPRDNSEVVLAALSLLARSGERPPLVIGGPIERTLGALRARAAGLGVAEQVRWVGVQTGGRLADLHRGAIAYVDPSLYEGFGLQALEAMACGTPAIASNRTSLPEIVGDGGVLLDPLDAGGFAEAMLRLLAEEGLRSELGRRALGRAAQFSWERTVRETLATCEEVAGRS